MMMKTRPTHPTIALAVVALQYLDVCSTWLVLRAGGWESAPLSAFVLAHAGGWLGLLVFKAFTSLCCVLALVLVERGWPEHRWPVRAVGLLMCICLLTIVAWNIHLIAPFLIATITHRG